jgi:hypothetical protein
MSKRESDVKLIGPNSNKKMLRMSIKRTAQYASLVWLEVTLSGKLEGAGVEGQRFASAVFTDRPY